MYARIGKYEQTAISKYFSVQQAPLTTYRPKVPMLA